MKAASLTAHSVAIPPADAPADKQGPGLGRYNGIAQLSATALIAVMFWQLQSAMLTQAHEDRAMLRTELRVMHDDSQRHWSAIKDNQQATNDLVRAVTTLTEEVRSLKAR